ncbi:MAG: acetylxylan esterase [Ruminococcaceae bacterium]|nr:acetylxylan esterase [Oscillospiraceae bacterium]
MRKFLAILLASFMMLSVLAACSDTNVDENNGDDGIVDVEDGNKTDDGAVEDPEDDIIPEKVLKLTASSTGNNATKLLSFMIDTFSVPAGSTLEYDVYIENDIVGLGCFELKYADGQFLSTDNDGSFTDNANITMKVNLCDLSDYALGKWYRREIRLNDGGVDSRDIDGIRFSVNGLTDGATYVCYYDNICIKNSAGEIIKSFTDEELAALEISNSGNIECSFAVVDDPSPRLERKTAAELFSFEKKSLGSVSDTATVDVVVDMENANNVVGVYFGGEAGSPLESLNSYVIYEDMNVLSLYHVTDKVSLASSVHVVNMVDDLAMRFVAENSMLNVYACDNAEGSAPKLIWSVPANIASGSDFGELAISGFGTVLANKEITAEDSDLYAEMLTYADYSKSNSYVNCSTDKNPLEYAVGENMIFDVTSYNKKVVIGCPTFTWMVEGDDGEKANGIVDASCGLVKVITSSKIPGFEYVEVRMADVRGNAVDDILYLTAGAGAAIHDMDVTVEKPADFDEYWQGKMDEIESIEPVLLESVEVEDKKNVIYYFKVDAGKYGPVTGSVSYSKKATPGSLKLKFTFMGYGVMDAMPLPDSGYISVTVNSHSIENGQPASYYSDLSSGELSWYGFNNEENADRETVYFLQMLMRDVQAIRYAMQNEYWNGKDLELEGASQGGFQSLVVGALMHEYVTKITSWAPAFSDWAGSTQGRLASTFPYPDYLSPLSYYDTVNFASMVEAPVSMLSGIGDTVCRPTGTSLLYDAIPTAKDITWIQNMPHGPYYDYCLRYTYKDN